jgi:pimeloyl-ACP methyl ester carboxylesterase
MDLPVRESPWLSDHQGRERAMQVTMRWLRMSGAGVGDTPDTTGILGLRHYNARVTVRGIGRPLVLVPGLAGGIALVEPLACRLAQDNRVFTYELRGEEDCFALRRRFNLTDLANDLAEVVSTLGLERPLVVGISFGGVVALSCAARFPDLFAAIGVQGVGLRFESGLVQRVASLVLANYPLPGDSPFVNQFFNVLFGGRPTSDQFEHVTRSCWQTDQAVMTHRLNLLRRLSLEEMSARVTAPTLVVSGSRDMIVSGQNARALADRLADSRQAVIQRAGHLAPVSHAGETARALHGFFSGIDD